MIALNSQQLAFLLDIKKEDARAKMCNAWTRAQHLDKTGYMNEVPQVKRNKKNKIEDSFPVAMPIKMLSEELNLPDLQAACDDIKNNYLERKATRRWIMWDYPEKAILKAEKAGKAPPYSLNIPPALASMLPQSTQDKILEHWKSAHGLNLPPPEPVVADTPLNNQKL